MTKIWLESGSINCTCCQDIPGCRNVPKEETDPIVDAVCAKLQSRSAVGLKKYGTTLADNAATVKEKLVHIQEELMDAANYVEWLLQDYFSYGVSPAMVAVKMMEKDMPTPMTIEMEAEDIRAALDQINLYIGYTAGHVDDEKYRATWKAFIKVHSALLTKTTKNVTCENLSNADGRQDKWSAFYKYVESETDDGEMLIDGWVAAEDVETIRSALQSPRVPDAMFKKLGFLIKAVDGGTFENDPHDAIIDAAIRTLSSPRVQAIDVLKECLKRIEGIRLVDLGAVRDAEMQDYQKRKIIARRELAETNDLINRINTAINSSDMKSPFVKVIDGLDEAIGALDYAHTTGGINLEDLGKIVKAARAYAELSKTKASGALDSASKEACFVEPSSAPPRKGV